MKKITKEAVTALYGKYEWTKGNTKVNTTDGNSSMYLNGSCIARLTPNGLEINHQGDLTNMTKERLNGVPGVSIRQLDFVWYLNGVVMKDGWNKI